MVPKLNRALASPCSAARWYSWAAFVSDAVIIKHPGHSSEIRSISNDADLFEGSIVGSQELSKTFVTNIQEIKSN